MIEDFDGKCGIIATFASSSNQIRCHYEMGHGGPCSFEKYRNQFTIMGGCGRRDYELWYLRQKDEEGIQRGFIDSVVYHSQKIHPISINSDGVIEKK